MTTPISGEPAMPPEAWLAERLGADVQQGWQHACPYCPGCVDVTFGIDERDLTDDWFTGMLVVKQKGSDYWDRLPIAPYSDAEAWVIEMWVNKAGYEISRYRLFNRDTNCVQSWFGISKDITEPDEPTTTLTAVCQAWDDTPKAALAAAVAKLREGA